MLFAVLIPASLPLPIAVEESTFPHRGRMMPHMLVFDVCQGVAASGLLDEINEGDRVSLEQCVGFTRFSLQRLSIFFASYSLWALYILENILEY